MRMIISTHSIYDLSHLHYSHLELASMDEPKDLRQAVLDSARFLGYTSMKEKQIEATCAFVEGHDTFVSLP